MNIHAAVLEYPNYLLHPVYIIILGINRNLRYVFKYKINCLTKGGNYPCYRTECYPHYVVIYLITEMHIFLNDCML